MTRQSHFSGSTLFSRCILSLFLLSASYFGFGQTNSALDSSIEKNISVKYLGTQEDMMLISVAYNNPQESGFNLSIYNSAGEILFRDIYHLKKFEKRFKVPKEQGKLNFVFAGMDDKRSRNYEVFSTSGLSDAMVITKVKE